MTARGAVLRPTWSAADSGPAAPVASPRGRVHWLVRWTFYVFLFSLPFEYPGRSIPVEITTLTGAVFLLAALLQPARCFRWPPSALWLFLGYAYAYWIAVVTGGGQHAGDAIKSSVTLLEVILIFWAAANILRDPEVANTALLIFAAATVILALMTLFGVMTEANLDPDDDMVRVTVLGQNANRAARILLGGLLTLVGISYGRDRSLIQPRFLVWPLALAIALAMIKGGSRGGLLALAIGLWAFMIAGKSFEAKVKNALVATLAIAVLLGVGLNSPLLQRRLALAGEGNFAKREEIFPNAFAMFLARPLVGWGAENEYELARRLPQEHRTSRDTHNLVLQVVTATGLLGAVPFFGGVLLALLAAWRGRRGPFGALPFALLVALMAGNMTGNYIVLKLQWVAFALAFASGVPLPAWPTRRVGWRAGGA